MDYKFTFRKQNPILFFIILILTTILILQYKTYYFASILLILWLFLEYFYRLPLNPFATSNKDLKKLDAKLGLLEDKTVNESAVFAPCYGTIKKIEYTKDFIRIISVLDITDVHYQFAPINGNLVDTQYKKGEFYLAGLLDKSKYNERNHCIFRNKNGLNVEVIQIAGVLAKRIKMLEPKKIHYFCGEPYGLIHFGSRVDTIMPNSLGKKSIKLLVKEGDKLRGFNTKIAIY